MISRRESLALVAGLALSPVAPTRANTFTGAGADAWTHTPDGLLQALMKLRAALDDRMTLEWFQGGFLGRNQATRGSVLAEGHRGR